MSNRLFLLCPTDYLESVINDAFDQENYFYNSLGNSFAFNTESLRSFIESHNIRKIDFVLAEDNQLFFDALGNQYFSNTRGLREFYAEIEKQQEASKLWSKISRTRHLILSNYLNKKVVALHKNLGHLYSTHLEIGGIIYKRHKHAFEDIQKDLIFTQKFCAN